VNHDGRDIIRLEQNGGIVGLLLAFEHRGLHATGRSTRKDTENANAVFVDFFAEAVRQAPKGMLRRGVL
jgi:hypothetical protein